MGDPAVRRVPFVVGCMVRRAAFNVQPAESVVIGETVAPGTPGYRANVLGGSLGLVLGSGETLDNAGLGFGLPACSSRTLTTAVLQLVAPDSVIAEEPEVHRISFPSFPS